MTPELLYGLGACSIALGIACWWSSDWRLRRAAREAWRTLVGALKSREG